MAGAEAGQRGGEVCRHFADKILVPASVPPLLPDFVYDVAMRNKTFRHIVSIPFIWGMLPVSLILHLGIFIYQAVAFRLYGIELVKLRSYVYFDRQKLTYLTSLDKLNCAYCSYVNGLFAYASEIGHRTEYYWCGVKHRNQPSNPAFAYQEKFAAYGDKEAYEKVLVDSGRCFRK